MAILYKVSNSEYLLFDAAKKKKKKIHIYSSISSCSNQKTQQAHESTERQAEALCFTSTTDYRLTVQL